MSDIHKFIGDCEGLDADEIDRTLPYCLNAERIYRSVDWQQFQQDNQAKRELWQQIQQI